MSDSPSIPDIVKRAGGAGAIAAAIEAESNDKKFTADAVYKWSKIGIPDRHWPVIMRLSGATLDQLHAANIAARSTVAA